MIHVQQQTSQLNLFTCGALQLFLETLIEKAPVVDGGERISQTLTLEAFQVGGVLDTDRHHRGQVFEKIGAHSLDEALDVIAADIKAADQTTVPYQRQQHHAVGRTMGRCK